MNELFQAIKKKDVSLAASLIAAGAPVNERNEGGYTPLLHAVHKKDVEMIKLLLAQGADVNMVELGGQHDSPLLVAARDALLNVVKLHLAKGADLGYLNQRKMSPLHEAVSERTKGHFQVMEALIRAGANLELVGYRTPLMEACQQALLDAGAQINAQTIFGTALTSAIKGERPDVVAVLLERGADVHSPHDDQTPIEFAKKVGNKKTIGLLEKATSPTVTKSSAETSVAFQ